MVLHREVVINTVDRAALDEADKYDGERRLEHEEYTRLFNEYEDTETEYETSDDEAEGDPKDSDYNPEGDGFVEDSPQEMARQILRDVQAQPAADQRRVAVKRSR